MLHILALTALTLNYFEVVVIDFTPTNLEFSRAYTVEFFIIGVQDIFVSYMLWFLMDKKNQPLYMKDNKTGEVYQVLNVIKDDGEQILETLNSSINIEDGEEEKQEEESYE